eukprot:TRINITY_DN11713_c0_g1_i1.p1 TRINITY_DN11713_c0_g1~~TRINITY_DN11713_c0_g1_i1.p1  ORF type:complete len:303 (-),score=73.49 TRINITY_DN11713_c0_g1_i1:79-987(-)
MCIRDRYQRRVRGREAAAMLIEPPIQLARQTPLPLDPTNLKLELPPRLLLQVLADRCHGSAGSRTALVEGDVRMSYRELDCLSNQLAHLLLGRGIKPNAGVPVGVTALSGSTSVLAMLAVIKTGNPYLPIDAGQGADRLKYILNDSGAEVVVTGEHLECISPQLQQLVIDSDIQHQLPDLPSDLPASALKVVGLDAVYLMYTSGSTSNPKGVLGSHSALAHRLQWMWNTFAFKTDEVVAFKTSLQFVDSVCEVFGTIGGGSQLVVMPKETAQDPEELVTALRAAAVTRITLTPSLLKVLGEG